MRHDGHLFDLLDKPDVDLPQRPFHVPPLSFNSATDTDATIRNHDPKKVDFGYNISVAATVSGGRIEARSELIEGRSGVCWPFKNKK